MSSTAVPKRRLKAEIEDELAVRLQQLADAELPVSRYYEIIESNPEIAKRYRTKDEHHAWLATEDKKKRKAQEQAALTVQGSAYRHMQKLIEQIEPKRFLWFEYYPRNTIIEAYRAEMNRLAKEDEIV